jgi:hypothetical protein
LFKNRNIPKPLVWHAFNVTLVHFFEFFPNDLQPASMQDNSPFSQHTDTSKETMKNRIYALRAISRFFDTEPGSQVAFLTYIDHLFVHLLNPTCHFLLQREIVHSLISYLSVTNTNRNRIELFYKPAVASIYPFKKNPDDRTKIHPLLLEEIFRFWSKWYPRTADETLLKLKKEKQEQLHQGYASRRLDYLLKSIAEKERPRTKLQHSNKPETITSTIRAPYTVLRKFKEINARYFEVIDDGEVSQGNLSL